MTPTQPTSPGTEPSGRGRWLSPPIAASGLIALAAAAFGLYEMSGSTGKRAAHVGACAHSLDRAQAADPLVHGEVAALMLARVPNQLGAVAFDKGDGTKTSVAAFGGKTILLNLWATWCVPCRAEMPALDKLQAQLGSGRFEVVPVNVDTVRLDRPRAFLKEIGATSLTYYADATADILQSLKQADRVVGLPTTILIGGDGCEIGTMAAPAKWDSPEAKALIERLVETAPAPARQT